MNTVEEAGEENKALDYSAEYIVIKKKKQAQKRVLEHYHLYTKKRSFKFVNVQPFVCTENHFRYGQNWVPLEERE